MDMITNSLFSTAVLVVTAMLLPVDAAIARAAMMDGGTMGNEHWYSTGEIWLPVLAIVVVGAVLFAVLRRKQYCSLPAAADIGHINQFNPAGSTTLKTSTLVAAVVTCALVVPMASAQDKPVPAKPVMSMPMDAPMSQMHTNMTLMQSQMDTIRATTDPKERQKLMQAHMQTMQDSMAMMRSMSKPMMMDGGQPGGMAMGGDKGKPGDKGMMGGDMMKHHQMMEDCMSTMQMMMEQMLQHLQVMESMPAK